MLEVEFQNGRQGPQAFGLPARPQDIYPRGSSQKIKHHVLWGDGLGSMADSFSDCLPSVPLLSQSGSIHVDSCGISRSEINASLFL